MLLLTSCHVDCLIPEGNEGFYHLFVYKYSLITVTTMVSQVFLMPDAFEGMTKEIMDRDVDNFIDDLEPASKERRDSYKAYCVGAGLNPGILIQDNENRTFINSFKANAKNHSLSSREMVLKGLNSSAFLNYFCLLEDSIKMLYIQTINSKKKNTYLKASLIIKYLRDIVNKNSEAFEAHLFERSNFFFSLSSLEYFWNILNFIRNKIIHSNGFYDKNSKRELHKYIKKFIADYQKGLDSGKGCLLSIIILNECFEKYSRPFLKTGFLIIDDTLENIIRNLSVFIMESLYLCLKDEKQ